jgi:hypothetical protein
MRFEATFDNDRHDRVGEHQTISYKRGVVVWGEPPMKIAINGTGAVGG